MEIRPPQNEEELRKCFRLRWEILRKPWDQPRGTETDELEHEALHIMVIDDGKVLATGRAHFINPELAQVRYMAVASAEQGKGLGGKLLQALENEVRKKGGIRIMLNSRSNAIDFYSSHGYRVTGN